MLVLYAGRVVEKGRPRALLGAPLHPYTRCLQLAIPSVSRPGRALYALQGEMPGIARLSALSGCRFAPRCPVVAEACREREPALVHAAAGREAACFRVEMTPSIDQRMETAPAVARRQGASLLAVTGLSKRYRVRGNLFGSTEVVALKGVSFAVAEDEFVGVVGESGSGSNTVAEPKAHAQYPERIARRVPDPRCGHQHPVPAGRAGGPGLRRRRGHHQLHRDAPTTVDGPALCGPGYPTAVLPGRRHRQPPLRTAAGAT